MRQRRIYGRTDNYNWQSRIQWYPVGFKLNHKTIVKQFGRLHYLACHAPEPITKKWRNAYANFYKKYFGTGKASVRFANTYTAHSWL